MCIANASGGCALSFFEPTGGELERKRFSWVAGVVERVGRIGVRAGMIAVAGGAILGTGPANSLLGGPASASAAVGMGMALVPDPVFSGAQTTQQKTELKAWGQAYWNRIEGVSPSGSTSSTAAWTF